jgi:hypothetical protein
MVFFEALIGTSNKIEFTLNQMRYILGCDYSPEDIAFDVLYKIARLSQTYEISEAGP